MASFCAQLCLRCRSRLSSRRATLTLQHCTQLQRCTAATNVPNKILNRSLFISGNCTINQPQRIWKQQMLLYSDTNTKHPETAAKEDDNSEELSRTDIVVHKSPLLQIRDAVPVKGSQVSLDLDTAPELSALEEISNEEALSMTFPSALPPFSDSLVHYVDKSEVLTKLLQLGVNLWELGQKPNVGSMLLRLDFNTDVAPKLLFLKEIGVEDSCLGYIITKNPFILSESVENLQARVDYLKLKKFSAEEVASMVSRAPYLLNFSVKRLDNRLGFYQHQLSLSSSNTRKVVSRLPRLLCGSLEPVKENLKMYELEFGFKKNEIQHIVLAVPKVLTANKKKQTEIFDFLHNTMKVPHNLITKFPQVLNTKYLRLKERHLFLQYLGKDHYDPAQPNYIPLVRLVSLPDRTFCIELAMATLEDFYLFQKTL